MDLFVHHVVLAWPLFSLVFVGYGAMRVAGWPQAVSDGLTRYVFSLALPALLFRLLSGAHDLPPVDARLLIAFFGACFIVFAVGRVVAWKLFRLDGVSQSVFALGGIFSNNVMLGLPLAKVALGDAAIPSVALVLVFNALILWSLVTVSVEWARHGSLSLPGLRRTVGGVLGNPIVAAILSGAVFGATGWPLPTAVAAPLDLVAQSAAPLALIALGMGLAQYGIREGWRLSAAVCAIKLVLLPLVAWGLALMLGLPRMETQVVVLLSSMATGANVYLMARQFGAMEGATAGCLVLSTLFAAVTAPALLALLAA